MHRRPSRHRLGLALVAAVAVALALLGCSAPTPTPVGPAPSLGRTAGYTAKPDGSVEATGYVGRSDLEGGFWALYDRPFGPSSAAQPKILAVLLPGTVSDASIAALKGAFVTLSGRVSEGASVRMAGPEVLVDSIAGFTSDAPR